VTRLLVTGASGYLGAYLVSAARGWEVRGTYYSQPARASRAPMSQIDLRDPAAVRQLLATVQPAAVIHTACSNRDDDNISAIVPAAHNLAASCREVGARLVHVSTDLVFDGEHAPYSDDAPPAPITAYGRAKAEAEAAVASQYPAAVIARSSLIWALDPLDRQTGWLVDGLRRGTAITLFTDEIRCPVHLPDLSAALLELATLPQLAGPLNLGGRQPLNRWAFGLRLLCALGLDRGANIQPGTVASSGLVRARNLTLESRRADQQLATRLRSVDDVLPAAVSATVQSAQRGG
jgi:dTDP-4-dehydrorhamnose reductase